MIAACPRDGTILPEDEWRDGVNECPHCRRRFDATEVVGGV